MNKYDLQLFDDEQKNATIDDGNLVLRSHRVAFMEIEQGGKTVLYRMQGFTQLKATKSTTEYSRHYVDEKSERTDITGFSPQYDYSFDRYSPFEVHRSIAQISDDELLGSDARRNIVVVDLFDKTADGKFVARKRLYSVVPSDSDDGTDALVYSGSFKAAGDIVKGTATVSDDGMIATFTADAADDDASGDNASGNSGGGTTTTVYTQEQLATMELDAILAIADERNYTITDRTDKDSVITEFLTQQG